MTRDEEEPRVRGKPYVLGRADFTPFAGKGKEKAEARLDEPGVAASDFRAEPIDWSPPFVNFDGELALDHRLGRTPSGIILIRSNLQLSWAVPTDLRARWTSRRVYLWVDKFHHWDRGHLPFGGAVTTLSVPLGRARVSAPDYVAVFGAGFPAAAGDHPPWHIVGTTGDGAGRVVSFDVRYATAAAHPTGQQVELYWEWSTRLDPSDEFRFLVV